MNKLIKKTALITIATLIAAALTVFGLWIAISPQTMATACEKTGNYSFAVTCAGLRYNRTKGTEDLARCAEYGILSGKDKHILNYCYLLVQDENYEVLCEKRNEEISSGKGGSVLDKYLGSVNYDGYIKSHLCAAQYRAGNLEESLSTLETDESGDSLIKLVLAISEKSDKAAAERLLEFLEDYEQNTFIKEISQILKGIN